MNQQATLTSSLMARFPVLERLRAIPKPALIGAIAAVAALVVAATMWSRDPNYKVLFSNLDDRDGGAIVAALNQMNVPYRFNDGGTALLVPQEKVYDTRLQLAAQGLPRGGSVGFELLDNSRFGASQFTEQINYQRALEGELARSIESVNSVQHARVHLAIPRQTLFVRDRQAPTASVLLNLYPGRSLGDGQVSSIAWLVASSVPELTVNNVSIVDQNGRLLSQPAGEGRGMDADQLRYVRETEQRTVERILSILNPLVGSGNVHAQASADMDFSRREETQETYRPNQDPGQAAVRSKQTSDSQQNGANAAQGVPGALSNQPPAGPTAPIVNPQQQQQPQRPGQPGQQGQNAGTGAATTPQPQGPSSERRDATTNYELDRTISHIKQPVGNLKRMSVAVVINYLPNKDGEAKAMEPDELNKLTTLVKEAMGYSEARGDSLNVVNSQFNDVEPSTPWWKDPDNIAMGKTALGWLAIAIAALWVWRSLLRPMYDRYMRPPEIDPEVAELERQEALREAQDIARAKEMDRFEENMKRARDMANKDPRAVAMVLRTWMNKDGK
ncbi:flagellar basal-body MS-ring/collar protein FliF [Achromobacter aloeverae]|uniref:Flagellar M-ring protein n=1 Tax=Achromobacter aloeverae TaxID=1750518 RepID=A0A4Q1HPE9_9BURK|nr:flagellar basal-body MS-ring/collar protein FliF [Achromobacter aloeverae]RXN92541.1 flagellar basal body M-ring protein FliF [Achromobacter aloeverae]